MRLRFTREQTSAKKMSKMLSGELLLMNSCSLTQTHCVCCFCFLLSYLSVGVVHSFGYNTYLPLYIYSHFNFHRSAFGLVRAFIFFSKLSLMTRCRRYIHFPWCVHGCVRVTRITNTHFLNCFILFLLIFARSFSLSLTLYQFFSFVI